jgi:(S)-2-hydroxy-acid oxidase
VEGEEGVIDVLRILREELRNAMALSGCRSLEEIASSLVVPTDQSLR